MKQISQKAISCSFLLLMILSQLAIQPPLLAKAAQQTNQTLLETSSCNDCIGAFSSDIDIVQLESFPVDLDLLFWADQPAVQAAYLNTLGNGSWGWMLTPWGGHFISNHFEGADKWYFYAYRALNITVPIAGKVKSYRVNNGAKDVINGNNVIVDVRLVIDIGQRCAIKFEHLTILESLHEKVKDGRYTFTPAELLGYPTNWGGDLWTIDFHYLYKGENICPYPGLSSTLQDKLTSLYALQYERAKIAGVFPETKLCNTLDIAIKDTIWGVWEYRSGPFDEFVTSMDRKFGCKVGGFTFLNRELCNPETFWRDMVTPSKNLSTSIIGVFRDATGEDVPGYNSLDICMVKQIEGTDQTGILELITTSYSDWGFNTSVFVRFSLDLKSANKLSDDILTIEYFGSLTEAQNGFTDNAITYKRFLGFLSFADIELYVIIGSIAIFALIVTAVALLIRRRIRIRKKIST